MIDLDVSVDRAMMLAFEGLDVPAEVRELLGRRDVPGFTLFRHHNVESPSQVRALTRELQAAATRDDLPLLVATDQEGGQLVGLGEGTTPFAGNMAIGATGDADLAERVARAIARELRAVGVNVNYAPVCDVASDPDNPSLGIRSFGDDPAKVGLLAAAMVRGLQAEGVAATLKHFPGKGDATVDPHYALPVLDHDRDRLEDVELVPFRAGVAEGAKLVMVGHYAMPRITGRSELPTSLSPAVVDGLLRGDLGYQGVAITDALDMKAVAKGEGQAADVVAAVNAGNDLLLCTPDVAAQDRIRAALTLAVSRDLIDPAALARSAERVAGLRRWVAGFPESALDAVGCAGHLALARELAEASVTLVRNDARLLPLRVAADARIAAIMPRPQDRTPADTSSTVAPGLADALRARHRHVDELVTAQAPDAAEIAAIRERAPRYDLLVVGSIDAWAQREQAALVTELISTGVPTVTVALRTPVDLAAYPAAGTHVCTYGILRPSMDALAAALWGAVPFRGRLPATVPGLYPTRHGLSP